MMKGSDVKRFGRGQRRFRRGAIIASVAAGVIVLTGGGVVAGVAIFSDVPETCASTPLPQNDTLACADVIDAGAGSSGDPSASAAPAANSFAGTTDGAGATDGTATGLPDDGAHHSVWFTWTPPQSGDTVLLPVGSDATTLTVYTGSGSSLDPVDATTQDGNVLFTASRGVTYTFRVDAADGEQGAFQYTIWQTAKGGPANDDLKNAIALDQAVAANGSTPGTLGDGTLTDATAEDGEPLGAGALPGGDGSVWYSWTFPNDGATLDLTATTTSGPGVTLATYLQLPAEASASPSPDPSASTDTSIMTTLTPLGDVAAPDSGTTEIEIALGDTSLAGQTVYVQVSGAGGDFTLSSARHGYVAPDTTAPTVDCTAPTGWHQTATVECTASDDDSGFAAGDDTLTYGTADGQGVVHDVGFHLAVPVPDGTVSASATSDSRSICDAAGNCASAGPVTGIQIDKVAPVVRCTPVPASWQTTATVTSACTASDGTGASGLLDSGDASFTLTSASVPSGNANGSVAFAPHGAAGADAPLGAVCDQAGNCAAIQVPSTSGDTDAAPTAKIDRSAPHVTCDTASLASGWSKDNVTVTCTATDTGSGLADSSLARFTLATQVATNASDGDASTNTAAVCDVAGNCVTAGPVAHLEVDRSAPVVTCDVPTPGTWYKGSSKAFACTATDSGSGLADGASFSLTASIPAGTESASVSTSSRRVCDVAGNCATSPSIAGVGLDDKAPIITCSPTPTSWQTTATVSDACTASAGQGSAVATADKVFTLTSATVDDGEVDRAAPMGSRQVCDAVGNCATTPALAAAKIDRVPPQVSCQIPEAPADPGYFIAEVSVTCTATDQGAGLADQQHATFTLTTSVGAGNSDNAARTSTRVVYDAAGNSYSVGTAADWPTFDVRRNGAQPAAPSWSGVPTVVTVVAAESADDATTGVSVPFTPPTATSPVSVAVGCSPDSSGTFPLGASVVHCTARDAADQTTDATFTVNVSADASLAPSGSLSVTRPVSVRGTGFSGTVGVELDGARITTLTPSAGQVSGSIALPDGTAPGSHTIVLRGVGADAQPRLEVVPLTLSGVVRPQSTGDEPTASDSPSPSESPTDSPTEPPVTTPDPQQHVAVKPARDRRAPFVYTVTDRITGLDACEGTVTVTASVKVTHTVVKKVHGKRKKVRVTSWKTVAQQRKPVATCSVRAKVSIAKSKLPKGKKHLAVRLSTVYADTSGARVTTVKTVTAR